MTKKTLVESRKIMKKLAGSGAAILLATGMSMQVPMAALAAEAVPSDKQKVAVQVLNVEQAAKVTAYRIVKPVYNSYGFVRFTNLNGVSLANPEAPTASEITNITQKILNGSIQPDQIIEMTANGKTYTANLPAGEYIVLVSDTESASKIYNPMVVSAYYENANTASSLKASAPLDSGGKFGNVYAKTTSISLDKTILQADGNYGNDDDGTQDGAQGDELGLGDTGVFRITTQIPAYSDAYKAHGVTYELTDSQDDGFDSVTDIQVKVGGQAVTAGVSTFTKTENGNDFTLAFTSDFALAHAGQTVEVTYKAKLNSSAKQKLESNNDKVVLTYTNDLYDKSHVDTLEDDVSEYTFPLQIKKISSVNGQDTQGGQPISGAEFTLTRKEASDKSGTQSITLTSNENGIVQFDRLDEGVYEVKESKAPAGYAINPDTFQITITPTYGTDGHLSNYQVQMINLRDQLEIGNITIDSADDDILAGNITDSKLQTLPSTGGAGSKFAILLAAAMSGVSISIFAFAKKKEKEEYEK